MASDARARGRERLPGDTLPIDFPAGRQYFTASQTAVLIGLTASFRPLIILLSHKYRIHFEDIGRSVIFSRDSVRKLRAALRDHQKTHPSVGHVRGPHKRRRVQEEAVATTRAAGGDPI